MFEKVLWWSGGDDSTLLLAMLREQGEPFDILQIRELWTKEQKKRSDTLIKEWKLKVFSYPPAAINLIGQNGDITSVWEYVVGGARLPMLRDIVEGTRCIAELNGKRMSYAPMEWDLHLVGTRKEDVHYATGHPERSWNVGRATFEAPLYEYTKADIHRELKKRGIEPTGETGDLELCTKCLHGETFCPLEGRVIPGVQWDKQRNLELFKRSYLSRPQGSGLTPSTDLTVNNFDI